MREQIKVERDKSMEAIGKRALMADGNCQTEETQTHCQAVQTKSRKNKQKGIQTSDREI